MGVRRRGAERARARVPWLALSFRGGRRAREAGIKRKRERGRGGEGGWSDGVGVGEVGGESEGGRVNGNGACRHLQLSVGA